jgi:hypothetical protein
MMRALWWNAPERRPLPKAGAGGRLPNLVAIYRPYWDLPEAVALAPSLGVIKMDNVGQFFAIRERSPFAIFIENRQAPESFTFNPIAAICFWKWICGKVIIHGNYMIFLFAAHCSKS